jgi:hypothetical protein
VSELFKSSVRGRKWWDHDDDGDGGGAAAAGQAVWLTTVEDPVASAPWLVVQHAGDDVAVAVYDLRASEEPVLASEIRPGHPVTAVYPFADPVTGQLRVAVGGEQWGDRTNPRRQPRLLSVRPIPEQSWLRAQVLDSPPPSCPLHRSTTTPMMMLMLMLVLMLMMRRVMMMVVRTRGEGVGEGF